jgi:hypothetical protein
MAVSTQAGNSADPTAAAQIALEIEGFAYLPRALGVGILSAVRAWREP